MPYHAHHGYVGSRSAGMPTVKTSRNDTLNLHTEVMDLSPFGFNWGFDGSGSRQLAVAILTDFVDAEFAREHYEHFAQKVIFHLPEPGWELTYDQVREVVGQLEPMFA